MFSEFQLFFLNHVHKFYACECPRSSMHFPDTSHRRCDPLDVTVVLFNNVIEIFGLAEDEFLLSRQPSGFIEVI
jgi:hypothetical protein